MKLLKNFKKIESYGDSGNFPLSERISLRVDKHGQGAFRQILIGFYHSIV